MIALGGAIIRFLSVFGTIEETSANDCHRRCDCSFPQCATSHCARIKLKKNKNKKKKKRKEKKLP
jgi:hypothetical protein